jgi:DNA-binding CsgD family transcriptional regulator
MAFMARYFVFFRCWPGFKEPFPFEEFNGLSDKELPAALELFARKQLRSAEVRERIKRAWKRRGKAFTEAIMRQSSRRLGGGPIPSRDARPALSFHQMRWKRIRRADREDLLVCRLGAYLGWWSGEKLARTDAVGPRVWFFDAPSRKFAEELVSELNARRGLDYDEHKVERHLKPRFGFVAAASLEAGQKASIQRGINSIERGKEPAVPHRKIALLVGQRARQVAKELAEAWPAAGDTGETKRQRRRPTIEPKSLTPKQAEVVHLVGECKGDLAEAARRLGRDRKTIKQHYDAAITKLGKKTVNAATKPLPTDRRGQENVADGDDRRHI